MFKNAFTLFLLLVSMITIFNGCDGKKAPDQTVPDVSLAKNQQYPKSDSALIFSYVEKQLENGPRVVGSKAHQLTKEFFLTTLRQSTNNIDTQDFALTGYDNEQLALTNIIAKFNPEAKKRIFICGHWDSRPRSDQETDEKLKTIPVMGANDGASGCAVMLELARIMKAKSPDIGVDLIFLDGEDYGKSSDLTMFCLGSKYFAANNKEYSPEFGILLDMVGDKEAQFNQEQNSIVFGGEIVNLVWEAAQNIGAKSFVSEQGGSIYDDHIPLNQAGLKTIDIIDASLVGADKSVGRRHYWHTTHDTIENISPKTLGEVADVLLNVIYSVKFAK
jgi:hypothetical protein